MVGVAGRSKGCVTCRKRKKGCDSKRPACSQCMERNIVCGGYDLDRVFITSKYASSSPPVKTAPVVRQELTMDLVTVTASTPYTMPASLERSAFSAKSMEAVFDLFPQYQDAGGSMRLINRFSSILSSLSMQEEALRQTVLAFGLVSLGKDSNNQVVIRQGRLLYSKALQEMGMALQSPKRRRSEAMLATTRLLAIFEMLYGADEENLNQARNWMSHAQGELALTVGRAPEAFTTDTAHLLFTLARYNTAIIGVRTRKPTVLDEEQWKTIPWQGRVKLASDTIIDILLEIPEILGQLDLLDTLSPDDDRYNDLRLKATAKCWMIHHKLEAWSKQNSHEVYTTDVEVPVPIEFLNLGIASLSLRYWATATLLYQSLDRALRFSLNQDLTPYVDRPQGRRFARLIVRSVSWMFRKENGIMGATAISFPLGVALMFLRQSNVPDVEYMNLVFSVWNDSDWPTSIKNFLRSMGKSIKLPTKEIPDNPATWTTNELKPVLDIHGNVLGKIGPRNARLRGVI